MTGGRALPNLGLQAFFDIGEDDWGDDMSLNLLKMSVLTQGGVLSKVSATPGSPTDGDVYIFDETHGTQPNKIAVRDAGAWVYFTPLEGWLVYNRSANYYESFSGTAWAELATGGVSNFADLGDVDVTTTPPTDGQVPVWDSADSKWKPGDMAGGGSTPTENIIVACSDETTALTAGTGKVTFRMPYAFTLTGVRASLVTAQTSGLIFTVDVNEGGASILSTKLTIDNTEKTSTTAATPAVISDNALADDAEITIDIDQIGDGTAKGLKVTLIGHQ